ncbi:MAG: hypothetical protein KME15_12315 [Drouetiella hepatica Uher 2000/2452]|jgi:uncharacterized protein involved in exopolysaccharide biosynthesis|uniref:Uncharacterized protein n=1 Tax=Drouetiella hepatica Uher 2000/2452 TaxID=904376 RepID=A0A951UML3_9CYAN|nr:hypothetical protein [Drouetiella hepatica Uher 2000/2452]
MDLEELESLTRDTVEQALNQLHAASLLAAQLERQIAETGRSVQALSQTLETFLTEQRQSGDSS